MRSNGPDRWPVRRRRASARPIRRAAKKSRRRCQGADWTRSSISGVHFFIEAGDTDHHRRLRLEHIGRYRLQALGIGNYYFPVEHEIVTVHPFENMGEGEKRETRIARPDVEQPFAGIDVGQDIPVGQRHPFGDASGSGGIDQGGCFFRRAHFEALFQRVRRHLLGAGEEVPQGQRPGITGVALQQNNPLQLWHFTGLRQDLAHHLGVVQEKKTACRIPQDVENGLEPLGVVNGDGQAAAGHRSQVGTDPIRPVGSHDRHPVAAGQSQLQQPSAEATDTGFEGFPGNVAKILPLLVPQGGSGASLGGQFDYQLRNGLIHGILMFSLFIIARVDPGMTAAALPPAGEGKCQWSLG